MKILCCVVTHNRYDYTDRCLRALGATAGTDDFRLIVVDNASTDGTQDFANVRNTRNLFPGAATNIGWWTGLQDFAADLLMRLDNDIEMLPGWREEVERAFSEIWELGQLGLLNMHEDFDGQQPVTEDRGINVHWPTVGGNCVIRRQLWDQGLRWQPGAWQPGANDEDTRMSAAIKARGLLVGRVIPTVAKNMSFHRYEDYPEYYKRTAALRGLVPELSV